MKRSIVTAAVLSSLLAPLGASQSVVTPHHRIVFQMTEPQGPAWGELMVHVNNLLINFANDGGSLVEVVFIGPGLNMLRKTNTAYEKGLKSLAERGVTLAACQNSIEAMKLKTTDLFPFVSEVRSGVAEIVRKQEAGWSYIH